jgi:hypothetical protein
VPLHRPPVATGRLSLTTQGQVRYTLKTPYRDGTTHVVFEPLDFCSSRWTSWCASPPWCQGHGHT